MLQRLYDIFIQHPLDLIAELISLLPFIAGLINLKYLKRGVKLLVLYFFIIIFRDFTSNVYAIRKVNNLFLYNASAFFEIVFICLVFLPHFNKVIVRMIVKYVAFLTLLVCCLFWSSNNLSAGVLSVSRAYSVVVVLFYFNQLVQDLNVKNILWHSLFWISSGLIIQFTGTFFVYLFANYGLSINTQANLFDLYWNMNQIMYIVFCVFSLIGIWVSKKDFDNHNG